MAVENRVGFQEAAIPAANVQIAFSTALSGAGWVAAASSPAGNSKYVRCTITRTGIPMWFMQVLGFGTQTVNALATATLAPGQNNCAIPMGLCTPTSSSPPDYGYVRGQWYSM